MKGDINRRTREKMVREQIEARGIHDPLLLRAFIDVPREYFIPESLREHAFDDRPLAIGEGQTISQPYIVALMTRLIDVRRDDKVLEVGTGSGYQAAILAYLGAVVYSVERSKDLADRAGETLHSMGYTITQHVGDGSAGWEEHAPYDKIISTAAAPSVPAPLLSQVKERGKIVIPLGDHYSQQLMLIEKGKGGRVREETVCSCIFVPLIGKYGFSG